MKSILNERDKPSTTLHMSGSCGSLKCAHFFILEFHFLDWTTKTLHESQLKIFILFILMQLLNSEVPPPETTRFSSLLLSFKPNLFLFFFFLASGPSARAVPEMAVIRLCWHLTQLKAENLNLWSHIQGSYLIYHLHLQHDCDFYTSQLYVHLCLWVLDLLQCVKTAILHLDCHFSEDKVTGRGPGVGQRLCGQETPCALRQHETEADVCSFCKFDVMWWNRRTT